MKRVLRALSAFVLSLVFVLAMAATPVRAAENGLDGDLTDVATGYLLILNEPQPMTLSFDPFTSATLMAAADEAEELLMLSESCGIYKAAALEDIQSLVYAGRVAVVEPDYPVQLFDTVPVTPNDPSLGLQKNLIGEYSVAVQSAWEAGLTGEGVTVAVIDSGLNNIHEDLPERVGRGRYFYYREAEGGRYEMTVDGVTKTYNYYSSGVWNDSMDHGSMVCGLIAAATNNDLGIAGIAPGVTILPIRCFTSTPTHVAGLTSNLISGLEFAVENGADIISMSWGLYDESATLKARIDRAYEAGCILIAAAGNDAATKGQYPAAWDNVISVGATDHLGRLCYYSQRVTDVDVCAPGGSSASRIYSLGSGEANSYRTKIGTSFSAPAVAAAAALLLQADPTMTQGDFLALLHKTSLPVELDDAEKPAAAYAGAGRMNIQALLDEVGYAGCSRQDADDGVQIHTTYHPTTDSHVENLLTMVGGYNEAGHLLESYVDQCGKSEFNNCAQSFTFKNPDIATFRVFYLDPDHSFRALAEPLLVS